MKEETRPPVITVLGHVDHGKTTLLDVIRKTKISDREFGGITQGIGASVVFTKSGKRITFIDTPGHAAFTKMRRRGAKIADIALLVVASDDGVKPQTLESLEFIKETATPFIVVASKTDLPTSNIESVKGQLEKAGVLFEGRGGDIPFVGLSAKESVGIDDLLEIISLLAEVSAIKGSKDSSLEAYVLETSKEKGGPLVSLVVKNGSIKVGQELVSGNTKAKVRGIFNDLGEAVKEVLPGEPAGILGFSVFPEVGSLVCDKNGENVPNDGQKITTKNKLEQKEGQMPIFLKAKNTGSLEAIYSGLPAEILVLEQAVGDITESDIIKARSFGAKYILSFDLKVKSSVLKLAETEGIKIENFKIIYDLFNFAQDLVSKDDIEILGKAEIVAIFPYNSKRVAGCKVIAGKITRLDKPILVRKDKDLGEVKIISIKREKADIQEAKSGEELGILFEPQLDFEIGDVLVSRRK